MQPGIGGSGVVASFWRVAVLGFVVLALADLALIAYAQLTFSVLHPGFTARAWPTFSRVLSVGDLVSYKWLAAAGGAGLFAGAAALAAMRQSQAREVPARRGLLSVLAVLSGVAALLGIVHYFLVTVSLRVNGHVHMALSYVFFFGMTLLILVDTLSAYALARGARGDCALTRTQRRVGWAVLGVGVVFLVTFVLKDVAANPWGSATQKVFVCAEIAWVTLTHLYAVLYVPRVRGYFGRTRSSAGAGTNRLVARTSALGLAAFLAWMASAGEAGAASATNGVGGSGRIQPAGGVIAVAGAPGRTVERVAVREGDRVRKGAVLVVFADEAARALERDVASERLRNAERQSVERRKIADLEVEAARVAHAQAQTEAAAVAALDERTLPARDRQQRAHALAQAQVALQLAGARQAEVRKTTEAELRIAAMNLKLAESALGTARILAPVDATVLEVHVQAGSSAGSGPAVTLANTAQMYVVADFFEGDLPRLNPGQRVKVSNAALGQPLEGAIERVGRVIDPVNRLAKVWVRLDRPSPADRFIGMQVDVKVDANPAAAPKSAP